MSCHTDKLRLSALAIKCIKWFNEIHVGMSCQKTTAMAAVKFTEWIERNLAASVNWLPRSTALNTLPIFLFLGGKRNENATELEDVH